MSLCEGARRHALQQAPRLRTLTPHWPFSRSTAPAPPRSTSSASVSLTFDNILLEAACRAVGLDRPWGDYADRCFRTLKDGQKALEPVRQGVHHHALADALHQAEWACAIFAARRPVPPAVMAAE